MAWQYNNPFLPQQMNPYMNIPQQAPTMQVIKVSGRGGAEAFQMGANSSAILLDESGTIVWLVVTDGAGYKTITAYDITPHQDAPAPDFGNLESRISKLEGLVNELSSNSTATRRSEPAVPTDTKPYELS